MYEYLNFYVIKKLYIDIESKKYKITFMYHSIYKMNKEFGGVLPLTPTL